MKYKNYLNILNRNNMELIILNIVAVVIILIVSIINIIVSINIQYQFTKQKIIVKSVVSDINDTKKDFELFKKDIVNIIRTKLEANVMNILDLDEFSELDPYIKDIYKNQIVKVLMPALMNAVNDQFYKENIDIKLDLHSKEIETIISRLAKKLKTDGLQGI